MFASFTRTHVRMRTGRNGWTIKRPRRIEPFARAVRSTPSGGVYMSYGRRSWIVRRGMLLAALTLAVPAAASASDWPFYGKDLSNSRNGGTDGPSTSQVTTLQQAWRFDTSDGDFTGTPVVAGGALVIGSSGGSIIALNSTTGQVRWSRDVNEPINGTAAI